MLAQIGEFAFVLLSRASNLHLVEGKMCLLLLGTMTLSLVTTPVLFRLIPAVMHLGVLMHWFPAETTTQPEKLYDDNRKEKLELLKGLEIGQDDTPKSKHYPALSTSNCCSKRGNMEFKKSTNHPILEEVMPLKYKCDEDPKVEIDSGDEKNRLSSTQLWNRDDNKSKPCT